MAQLWVHLENNNGACRGRLQPAGGPPGDFYSLALGRAATLALKGQTVALGALVSRLMTSTAQELTDWLDERGQLQVGHHLFTQLFRALPENEQRALAGRPGDLRIVTRDEHLAQLPWGLLCDGQTFLAAAGWSVAVSAPEDDCRPLPLPPSPRILLVAPEPECWPQTGARQHLADLTGLLSAANRRHTEGRNLQVVKTWSEFCAAVTEFKPDILYYYGHGAGNDKSSSLIFAEGPERREKKVLAANVAQKLRGLGQDAPRVAYLNCCSGEAGGWLGIGAQLATVVPAVISNCTRVYQDAAQQQALAIWRGILLDGLPPHQAVAQMRRHLVGTEHSLADVGWLAPVVHSSYDEWNFTPPQPLDRLNLDRHWRETLDRVRQTGEVMLRLRPVLAGYSRRALAFSWYGQAGQGLEQFYQRLEIELGIHYPGVQVYAVRPRWPLSLTNLHQGFTEMLEEAFGVNFREIPALLRQEANRSGARQMLVYLRHPPIAQGQAMYAVRALRQYLEWLDGHFANTLPGAVFALAGISFAVNEPAKFRQQVVETERLPEQEFSSLNFHLLDELKHLDRQDLVEFLRAHDIKLPVARRNELLDDIVQKTGGHYEQVLDELIELVNRAWDMPDDAPDPSETGETDGNF